MMDPANPKLKDAMEEVKAILAKYDIAGSVTLCSGEQSEYLHWVASPHGPSWSCLLWEPQGIRIRAKAKRDMSERYRLNSTVKMIHTMRDVLALNWGLYNDVAKLTERHLEIDHGERAHLSHDDYLKRKE